jgi:hypothetical protein
LKVDIGHESHIGKLAPDAACYFAHRLRLAHPLRCEAHDAATRGVQPAYLSHRGFDVVRVGVGHRLHGDRMVHRTAPATAYGDRADGYGDCRAATKSSGSPVGLQPLSG